MKDSDVIELLKKESDEFKKLEEEHRRLKLLLTGHSDNL